MAFDISIDPQKTVPKAARDEYRLLACWITGGRAPTRETLWLKFQPPNENTQKLLSNITKTGGLNPHTHCTSFWPRCVKSAQKETFTANRLQRTEKMENQDPGKIEINLEEFHHASPICNCFKYMAGWFKIRDASSIQFSTENGSFYLRFG